MLIEINTVTAKLIKISNLKSLAAIKKMVFQAFFTGIALFVDIVHQNSAIV